MNWLKSFLGRGEFASNIIVLLLQYYYENRILSVIAAFNQVRPTEIHPFYENFLLADSKATMSYSHSRFSFGMSVKREEHYKSFKWKTLASSKYVYSPNPYMFTNQSSKPILGDEHCPQMLKRAGLCTFYRAEIYTSMRKRLHPKFTAMEREDEKRLEVIFQRRNSNLKLKSYGIVCATCERGCLPLLSRHLTASFLTSLGS